MVECELKNGYLKSLARATEATSHPYHIKQGLTAHT